MEAVADQSDRMNGWECQFVENLCDVLDRGVKLSEKQVEKLKEIYDRLY